MAKGNRLTNEFIDDIWKDVFYKNVGTYVNIISQELGKIYQLEPLSKYIKIGGGYAFKTNQYKKSGIPIIRISDFNNEKIDISNCVFYDEDPALSKYELNSGDIIICLTGGTISKLGIVQENLGKLYLNQRVGRFDIINENKFEKEYVYWIAKSVSSIIKNLAWGAAIPNVSPKQIEKLEFAIPPVNVQKNIVRFLNDLKDENIEGKYFHSNIEEQILKLHSNNLNQKKLSVELKNQLTLISQLRQAFLKEAMQGKLVSNETSDGKTGADLLAEIKTEKEKLIKEKKIKKGKPLPPISEEEIPFDIPENWAWCRLGEIAYTAGRIGWKGLSASEYKKDGPMFVSVHSLNYGDYVNYAQVNFISNERYLESPEIMLKNNDILICKDGAGIGKLGIVKDLNKKATINSSLLLIRTNLILNHVFLYNSLRSPQFQSIVIERIMGATTPHLYQRDIVEFLIPLPPLEIQNRIVFKLEELMTYCDDLENSVKESQSYNEQLLQQVLREALEVKEIAKEEILPLVAEEKPIYSISNHPVKSCDIGDMAILAGYIIKKLSTQNPKDFGRVKLQKMLHLIEYYCQLSTELKYQKNVAGPYSSELEHLIEPKLKAYRFFDIKKEKLGNNSKVTYTPLSASNGITSLFNQEFKDQSDSINNLLNKFQNKNWEFCEMISTMYAVWNNRLIRKELFTDDLLKKDFLEWDKEKIKFIDQLDHAIYWIRKEKIEPMGFGEYIDVK